ncbi:hypothetical protein [Mesobacillus zeae]|uniref:hypothetical protein n=1 Tax=Mesobacillus zeae TaxID=1917180 RepID=UPI00300B5E56
MLTFTITIDWLVYFYWLIEMYMFVYCQELRIRNYYQYYEELAAAEEDCMGSLNNHQPIIKPIECLTESVQVAYSSLDEKSEQLFTDIQKELGLTEPEEDSEAVFHYADVDLSMDMDMGSLLPSEDCIQINDFEEEEKSFSPTGYENFASAKIVDCLQGAQKWVVSIIGQEDSYIHVSDGKRIWLNVGDKAAKMKIGDVLELDVIRNGKEITVNRVSILETDATEEYSIPDEYSYYQQDYQAVI